MDALNPGVVDVFLAGVSQIQGDRSGPIGRVIDLKNGVVTHYNPGQSIPSRIKVQQRNGFKSLTTGGHNATTGATSNPSWSNPELLSTLGDQLLSIANAIPRVYDGSDWTHYPEERVVTNRLSQSIFHTSQRMLQVQDHARIGEVTCAVWNEQPNPETTTQILYIGFRGDDETWVRTPQILYDPLTEGDHLIPFAKVKADASGLYFWVVFNSLNASADKFTIKLFNLNGLEIDSEEIAKVQDVYSVRSFWDIAQIPAGGLYFAQPLHTVASATDGVRFTTFAQTLGVISSITTDNSLIHCRGPLGWLTNDLGNGRQYLATIGLGEEPVGKLWAYEISPPSPSPFTHEYNFDVEPAVDTTVDSLIGFTSVSAAPVNPTFIPDVTVSFTSLQEESAASGPLWDPQCRFSEVWSCDINDVASFIRQNDYTCQVSRAFKHDGEYYAINYYQSGSGNEIKSTQVDVAFTDGDYMIGNKLQSVKVTSGIDFTSGAPKNFLETSNRGTIQTTGAFANSAVLNTDTVTAMNSGPDLFNQLIATGTPVLKWKFINLTVGNYTGAQLVVAGSSIPDADGTWNIVGFDPLDTHVVYTLPSNVAGGTTASGTFTSAGTFQINSLTNYRVFDLGTAYSPQTSQLLVGGTIVVTGNGTPGNNGTKTIVRANPNFQTYVEPYLGGVWVATTTESTSSDTFTATINPALPSQWSFDAVTFDDSLLIGPHTLIVSGSEFTLPGIPASGPIPVNNDSVADGYAITDAPSQHTVETDGNAFTAEYFSSPSPFPTVSIRVPDDVTPYTFFLQDIDPDYTYQNATLIVTNDGLHPENNGVYQIIGFDPDPTHHIVYCVPIDGRKEQRSQLFIPDDQVITIVFQNNVNPEFQPCWLMVPLTGTKPVVGRFDYLLASADWRFEGSSTPNLFPGAVTSPVMGSDGWLFMLPYRAVSFTVGQSVAVNSGQVVDAAISGKESTIGLKQFNLSLKTGAATGSSDQLMLPGPMCGQFTTTGFTENGVNFGFEAPYIISQQVSSSNAALRVGGSYQVVFVAEIQEENGNRTFSIVSPPLNFTLTGTNNSATYGIRMMQPLDSAGNPVAKHFGVTNRRLIGISGYRTAYQGDVPTTERHKFTPVLNVNGLAPISDTNDSGFAFNGDFAATYLDENLDAAIISNEVVYTDKGFLPRFPAPAQRNGDFWKQRTWVVGYDGAIWMSGEKREGDSTWFFPAWRIVLPTTDKPVADAEMDDYLVIGCQKTMWYIPAGNLPDSTGREGLLPTPVQLPFSNGCTGHMITLREGVAYSSTDGGVWMVTRGLTNHWLSQPIQDYLAGQTIASMAIDKRQRLCICTNTGNIFVYDQTVKTWYRWPVPASDVHFLAAISGEMAFQEDNRVWVYDPSIYYDNFDGSKVGIPIDVTLSSFQFGNVRGLKSCWAMQIVGDYKGPHNINAILSYPDDDPDSPTVFPDPADGPYQPDSTLPYLLEINPMIEQASSYGLRIFADFVGIENPGNSFELELISCEVGMDSTVGVNKFADNRRIPGA